MEQNVFTEGGFRIEPSFVLAHKEIVTDFFGDNRHWYEKLRKGGIKYGGTSLDSQEEYDEDLSIENLHEKDLPPLDPARITEGRAESIALFFEEYKDAQDDFFRYSQVYDQK